MAAPADRPTDVRTDSYPRQSARTARFTAGAPRAFRPLAQAGLVAFLRSESGTSRATALRVLETDTGTDRLVADPAELLSGDGEQLTAAERSRRERMREGGAGITAFSCDEAGTLAVFALSSRVFVSELAAGGGTRELAVAGSAVDPRLSPDGSTVAYVADGALHVVAVDGSGGRPVAVPAEGQPDVTWGLADFAAAEELERFRGFWWAPDSASLLVARVDESPVAVWYIADPENPEREPRPHRYPAAGTANALVTLHHVGLGVGSTAREVAWDLATFPYLVDVQWVEGRPALLQVLSRRQERAQVLAYEPADGAVTVLREQLDACWVDTVPGTPTWTSEGGLVTVEVDEDRYALCVDGAPVSPAGTQVRRVQVAGPALVVHWSDDTGSTHVARWTPVDGWEPLTGSEGVHAAVADGGLTVFATSPPDEPVTRFRVVDAEHGTSHDVTSHAVVPPLRPAPVRVRAARSAIATALVLPTGWQPGGDPLPVLLDPYGGPHFARVLSAARAYLESQWWADQGFAVVVADGRGTPGTPSWERAVRLDLTVGVLDDQVTALHAVDDAHPGVLDLDRVAMRGWSFGGYLSALAVLRRPDVFHAAVAGAPCTDWRLYDTAYTERYLGLPEEHSQAYEAGSLLPLAAGLSRPLLVIHGLSDDNVAAAHSLRLSSALLAAGRPHTFLPLSGVTHMTPQEVVAENLLLLQLDFLRGALGLDGSTR